MSWIWEHLYPFMYFCFIYKTLYLFPSPLPLISYVFHLFDKILSYQTFPEGLFYRELVPGPSRSLINFLLIRSVSLDVHVSETPHTYEPYTVLSFLQSTEYVSLYSVFLVRSSISQKIQLKSLLKRDLLYSSVVSQKLLYSVN